MADLVAPKEEITEVVSDRDAVNNDVRDAIASLKEPEAPEVVEPEAEAEKSALPARERGPDGKFLPKTESTEAAPAKVAPETLPAPEQPTKASAAPSTASAPPVSWAADAKAQWASLPPAIQQAVIKRETEASNGFAQYSEKTKAYERALAPVAQEAQRFGLNVEDGIKRLIDGHRFLETQPAQAILWLAQKHGFNLAELASNPPAPQMPVRSDSIPPEFKQHVSNLEERLNGFFMDQNMSAVQQFAADPKHAFYTDVEAELPDIMGMLSARDPALKGVPLLEKAYDYAIRFNEDVWSKVAAEKAAQTTQVATQKVAAKAQQSARAAVSVRGSSADTRPPAKPNGAGDSVYDAVRESINQLRSG